ncbi:MAG: flagellar FlbD family protein [Deltaproteobacteria bacterium]|nr:flagellar FlbD family protein [Deltaproteobacteria bacterium]
MLKLTRLNRQTVAINPDHIVLADASPDTTLRMLSGETILVRESLDEVVDAYVGLRRKIHSLGPGVCPLGRSEGERPPVLPRAGDEEEG